MAAPTFAEVWNQIKAVVKIYDDLKTNGSSYLTNLDAYQQSLEGDHAVDAANLEESTRSALSGLLRRGGDVVRQHMIDMGKVISSSQTTPEELMDPIDGDLFQYFINNAQSLNSRNITHGSPSAAAGNVGNGLIYRLATDRNSQEIETVSLTSKKAECVQDSNSGTRATEETFLFTHEVGQKDGLDASAFSPATTIVASGPENSLLQNASFEEIDGTTGARGLSSIPSWTIDTGVIADFEYDSTNFYSSSPSELESGNSYALKIKNNVKISQKIRDIGQNIDPTKPYMLLLHYNRSVGASDGTLTIRMGTASASVTLTTQSGWQVLVLALDQNLWYSNFKENDLNIEVELSGWTTGTLLIDWVIFDEMKEFDRTWYLIKPGATNFQKGDSFTWSDTLSATEGKIQYWLSRWFGRYLPHNNAGTETITDP